MDGTDEIADARCLWLTTVRPDGSPHTAPVWFVVHGPSLWVATSTPAVKVRNLEHDARVSAAVDGTSADPWVAEATVTVHADWAPHAAVRTAFADKYGGWDAADPAQWGPRVLLELRVDRWLLGPTA